MWTFKIQAEMALLKLVAKILSMNELEADNLVGTVMVGMYPVDKNVMEVFFINFMVSNYVILGGDVAQNVHI